MNREQKRAFVKAAKKRGVSEEVAKAYIVAREADSGRGSAPRQIADGDRVKLDVNEIRGSRDYDSKSTKYRSFVESNAETVFTAHIEKKNLISLYEHPEWLFWSGHLIKVDGGSDLDGEKLICGVEANVCKGTVA